MINYFQQGGLFRRGQYQQFVNALYPALYQAAKAKGLSEQDSINFATNATVQAAFESGYGTNSQSKNYNYGGLVGGRNYKSYNGYANYFTNNVQRKWPKALKANNVYNYAKALHSGPYVYSGIPANTYAHNMIGIRSRVLKGINTYKAAHRQPQQDQRFNIAIPMPEITNPAVSTAVNNTEIPNQQ